MDLGEWGEPAVILSCIQDYEKPSFTETVTMRKGETGELIGKPGEDWTQVRVSGPEGGGKVGYVPTGFLNIGPYIKTTLESEMKGFAAEVITQFQNMKSVSQVSMDSGDADYNTLICIDRINATRISQSTPINPNRSIFMTTGYSYCYMFEEWVDENIIMFCDVDIDTLIVAKKYIKHGLARRNYEKYKCIGRNTATLAEVMLDQGIDYWYDHGPFPRKTYVFIHMNFNDQGQVGKLLETIKILSCKITTLNLSNVFGYIKHAPYRRHAPEERIKPVNKHALYKFFGEKPTGEEPTGEEPAIDPNCWYIISVIGYTYYYHQREVIRHIENESHDGGLDRFRRCLNSLVANHVMADSSMGEEKERSLGHWTEFDDFTKECFELGIRYVRPGYCRRLVRSAGIGSS